MPRQRPPYPPIPLPDHPQARPLPTLHAASGWRIHCGVEVTESSTNKQHTLSRHCPHCPPNTLGDELHMILACPHHAPQSQPAISALSHLLCRLCPSRAALTPLQQISPHLALDPRHYLSGQESDQWIRELAPLAASLAIVLRNSFATPWDRAGPLRVAAHHYGRPPAALMRVGVCGYTDTCARA
jgi:hypothetical protein